MDSLFTPYLVTGICAALVVACSFKVLSRPDLDHIPIVGHSSLLASYWFTKGLEVDLERSVQEGCDKYKSGVFRVANLTHWVVCLPRSHLEQVTSASEDHLSFYQATKNSFKTEYTLGSRTDDPRPRLLIRSHLTRYLSVLYEDLRDEIVTACNEFLNPKHNEWEAILALHVSRTIVSRASNRVIVGLPLCRDPTWLNYNIFLPRAIVDEFFHLVSVLCITLKLDRLAAKFFTDLSGRTGRGVTLVGPVIKERLQHMAATDTDWCDKPNDYLQWWMDTSHETSPILLMQRILSINFAAIHSTSNTFSQALLNLAGNPQHAQELRNEVEAVISEHGWTKGALSRMRKVDSFLKETQRFEGNGILGLMRVAMSDITLADGTYIPRGSTLAFPSYAMHHDDAVFENPNVFEPFRFADMPKKEMEGSRHQMVALSPNMLSFGLGTHACPGRFFAATVLKTMLAHIVMSYDVKLEDDKPRLNTLRRGRSIVPNPAAKVMFRKRVN
ncbi:cytochrome P450 [Pisolithus marmoratus]|nr:cytochrome P450 [Pisolithus marmoratus]